MICAFGLMLAVGTFTACSNDDRAEEDRLYENGIDKDEVKNEDTWVFDIEIENEDYQAIDKDEVKNEDT